MNGCSRQNPAYRPTPTSLHTPKINAAQSCGGPFVPVPTTLRPIRRGALPGHAGNRVPPARLRTSLCADGPGRAPRRIGRSAAGTTASLNVSGGSSMGASRDRPRTGMCVDEPEGPDFRRVPRGPHRRPAAHLPPLQNSVADSRRNCLWATEFLYANALTRDAAVPIVSRSGEKWEGMGLAVFLCCAALPKSPSMRRVGWLSRFVTGSSS